MLTDKKRLTDQKIKFLIESAISIEEKVVLIAKIEMNLGT